MPFSAGEGKSAATSRFHSSAGLYLILFVLCLAAASPAADLYVRQSGWVETIVAARAALTGTALSTPERTKAAEQIWLRV